MTYAFGHPAASLEKIMAEWGSTDSYATRVADISNGGGLNGTYLLKYLTVRENGQVAVVRSP